MPYLTDRGDYVFVPPVEPETRSSQAILGDSASDEPGLLDEALEEFLSKNADYKDASDALGIVGQVADLWRKIVKLKTAVIDGGHLNGETPHQLIRDIFGHSLLALYYDDILRTKVKETIPVPDLKIDGVQAVVNAESPPTRITPVMLNRFQATEAIQKSIKTARRLGLGLEDVGKIFNEVWGQQEDVGAKSRSQAIALQRIQNNAEGFVDEGGTWDQIRATVEEARVQRSMANPFSESDKPAF